VPTLLPLLANNYWQGAGRDTGRDRAVGAGGGGRRCPGGRVRAGDELEGEGPASKLSGEANNAAGGAGAAGQGPSRCGAQTDAVAEKAVEDALGSMRDPEALASSAEGLGSSDPAAEAVAVKVLGLAKSAEHAGKLKEIAQDASGPLPLRVSALRGVLEAGGEEGEAFAVKGR